MNKMSLCFIVSATAFQCSASSVNWDVIAYGPNNWGGGGYMFVGESPVGVFGAYFLMDRSPLSVTLSCNDDAAFFLGYVPSWWRVVEKGSLVDYDSIIAPHDDYFYYYGNNGPVGLQSIIVPRSMTVVLAFATGGLGTYYYGWVELGYNGNLYIVNSAMEITGQGIYAGTGIATPEPSSALLALSGMAFLLLRRRRTIQE